MTAAVDRLREKSKECDLNAEALKERETPEAYEHAADYFLVAWILHMVADALDEEAA